MHDQIFLYQSIDQSELFIRLICISYHLIIQPRNKIMINHQELKINQERQKSYNIIISPTTFQGESSLEERAKATIYQTKKELDLFIDQLDQKIRGKMEAGEVVFLKAYQNHLEKITKQLRVLKQTYDVEEAKIYADKIIINLGKQTILFRQEAIRLQDQLQEALGEQRIYRRKCQLLEKQIINTNKALKKQISLKMKAELEIQKLRAQIQGNRSQIEEMNLKLSTLKEKQGKDYKDKQATIKEKDQNIEQSVDVSIQSHLGSKQAQEKHYIHPDKSNKETVSYPVFEIQRGDPFIPQTPKNKPLSSPNRTCLKTKSTLEFNQSSRHFALFDAQPSRISQVRHLNEITKQKDLEQAQYRILINKIIGFRKRDKKAAQNIPVIQSRNIHDFLQCDYDISTLCSVLFPNIQILPNFQINNRVLHKQRSSKLTKQSKFTHLSTEIMKNMASNRSNMSQSERRKTQVGLRLNLDEIGIIHKKAKIKNEVQKEQKQKEYIEGRREKSLMKMNQMFKKRKLGSKIGSSSFYLSARGIKDKWN